MIILITGGCGFIGSNFVRYLRDHHPEDRVVVLDVLTYAGRLENLDGVDVPVVTADVADVVAVRQVFRQYRFDAVVHLAAESHVDRSIADPLAHVRTNVFGTAVMVEAAREAKVERFLHVSTDEVLGSVTFGAPALDEGAPIRPTSPYAASKAAGECLALAAHRTYRFPVVVVRPTNCYGPRQYPEKLVPLAVLRALAGEEIPIYGDGLQRRDWLHVDDLCRALDLLLRLGCVGEVYHVAGRSERANLEVAGWVCKAAGRDPGALLRHVGDRPGHDRRYALRGVKAELDVGFRPGAAIEDRIGEVVDWYQKNEGWWRPILNGEHREWVKQNYGAR